MQNSLSNDNISMISGPKNTLEELKYGIENLKRSIEEEKINNEKLNNTVINLNKNRNIIKKKIEGKVLIIKYSHVKQLEN